MLNSRTFTPPRGVVLQHHEPSALHDLFTAFAFAIALCCVVGVAAVTAAAANQVLMVWVK